MTGEYICFIDSDDFVAPGYCEVLLTALIENNVDISVCGTYEFLEEKEDREIRERYEGRGDRCGDRNFFLEQCLDHFYFGCTAWAKMYKSSLFNEIRYPIGMVYEDFCATYRLGTLIEKTYFTDKCLYYYRRRNDSISKSKFSIKNVQRLIQVRETIVPASGISAEHEKKVKHILADCCYDVMRLAIEQGDTSQKQDCLVLLEEIRKAKNLGAYKTVALKRKIVLIVEETVLRQAIHVNKDCPVNSISTARTIYRLMTKLQRR